MLAKVPAIQYIALMTLTIANALCSWCDDVIDNVLFVPRPHTDSGERD